MSRQARDRRIALIADDDQLMRVMLSEAVEQAGLEPIAVGDGADALAIGRSTEVHLVLLDVEMPGLDGYAVCEALRQSAPGRYTQIVMITGHDDADSVDRAYDAGATDFMSKPLNWPLIAHRLRYLLRNAESLRQLDQREAENRALLESIPDRIHLLDAAGNVLRTLREALRNAPDGSGTTAAGSIADLVPAGEAASARRSVVATAADGRSRSHEYSEPGEDTGTRYYGMRYLRCGGGEVMAMRRDITERHEQERRIRELAYGDALTGLPNRQAFVEGVSRHLEQLAEARGGAVVLYRDLDELKRVNDTFGHAVGDRLLRAVGAKLRQSLDVYAREGALTELARFGGDEFVIFIGGGKAFDAAVSITDHLDAALAEPLRIDSQDFFVVPSIGVAMFPSHGEDIESLLKNADTAVYQAKRDRANRRAVYSSAMSARAHEWLALDSHLRRAVRQQLFELYFQPKYRLRDRGLAGAEALIRWFHPVLGEITPGRFIPLAEETGLIIELGTWVVEAACRQLWHWQDQGMHTRLAVNVSGREFLHGDPAAVVRASTAASGIEPSCLEIEITESVLVSDSRQVQKSLADLRAMGCRIALDDFGTGYSSLAYLRRFPPDVLKVDRTFVRNVHRDRGDAAIFDSILALASTLGVDVVAEGVEEEAQLDWLKQRGCQLAQGYLLARPMSGPKYGALLGQVATGTHRLFVGKG